MKKIIIVALGIILIVLGVYFYVTKESNVPAVVVEEVPTNTATTTVPTEPVEEEDGMSVLGTSADGRDIVAYSFGNGNTELLFVSGIHGGYSWNTILSAYEMMDYVTQNPSVIPENIKLTIIPLLNPDGLHTTLGSTDRFVASDIPNDPALQAAGRFNGNNVDLNRNFDCDWKANAVWQNKQVSGGSKAFSEPETIALKNYVENNNPAAVVAFYSAAGGVFASNCYNGVSAETNALTKLYADASGYKAYQDFDFYETTGDMTNWLAKIGVPAISVLLTNHTNTEWTKNRAGLEAILNYYAQ